MGAEPPKLKDFPPSLGKGVRGDGAATGGSEIYELGAKLPESIDLKDWSKKTTKQQLSAMQRSGLSKEEWWKLLNADDHYLEALGTLRDLQKNPRPPSLAEMIALDAEFTRFAEAQANLRGDAQNPLVRQLDDARRALLGGGGTKPATKPKTTPGLFSTPGPRTTPFPQTTPRPQTTPQPSPVAIPVDPIEVFPKPKKSGDTVAYIFYTAQDGADFEEQSKYQERLLRERGYEVRRVCTNDNTAFVQQWKSMDVRTGAAVVLSHSNGMSLIFEEDSQTNAISVTGKNRQGAPLPSIGDLYEENPDGPDIETLLLLACNAGHTDLYAAKGTNVADAFRDLPNVGNVYAYDGSVGFGDPRTRKKTGEYPPRLSRIDQDGYRKVYDNFEIPYVLMKKPSGLVEYEDE